MTIHASQKSVTLAYMYGYFWAACAVAPSNSRLPAPTCNPDIAGKCVHFLSCAFCVSVLGYSMPVMSLLMSIVRQSDTEWRGVWKGGTEYVHGADYLDVYYKLLRQRTAKL